MIANNSKNTKDSNTCSSVDCEFLVQTIYVSLCIVLLILLSFYYLYSYVIDFIDSVALKERTSFYIPENS